MRFTPGMRRGLIALFIIAVLGALLWFVPPVAARHFVLDYLDSAGVDATIGDVDANILTGHIEISDAHGEAADGDDFDIAHLAGTVDYWPLLSRRIRLSRLALRDARIDIHRSADDALRIGGITVVHANDDKRDSSGWAFGLERLRLAGLQVMYSQPEMNGRPAIERTLRLHPGAANDVITWQPNEPVPLDADMTIGDSRIRLDGTITPFGTGVEAALEARTEGLDLDLLSPFAGASGFEQLAGQLDSDVRVDAAYSDGNGLTLTINGASHWQNAALKRDNGLHVRSERFDWQGTLDLALLQSGDAANQIDSKGQLEATALEIDRPDRFSLAQAEGRWQGQTHLVFAPQATRINGEGELHAGKLRMDIPDAWTFQSETFDWQGTADVTLAELLGQRSDGRIEARNADLTLHTAPLTIQAGQIVFDGVYQRQPGDNDKALVLGVDGALDTSTLRAVNTHIGAYWGAAGKASTGKLIVEGKNRIRLGRLEADNLRILERAGAHNDADRAAMLQADHAVAADLSLDDLQAYGIGDLVLTYGDFWLARGAEDPGSLSRFFADDDSGGGDQPAASDNAGPTLRISQTTINGPSNLHYRDHSVDPAAQLHLTNLSASIDDFDTATPEQSAHYTLSADEGDYGHIDSSGDVAWQSANGPDLSLTARIRSLALPPLSGYMQTALSRSVGRGTADADLDLDADNGQLDGTIDVTLSNFHLGDGGGSQVLSAVGLSLDDALALVRSEDDTIAFSTDILGNIATPRFAVNNLIREAIYAGLSEAILSYYSPLGLLNEARKQLTGNSDGLQFEPIGFDAGKARLGDAQRQQLAKIGTALSKRPDAQLTVCGHAVPADADAMSLFGGESVDDDNRGQLRQLATKRAQATRDYLAARELEPSQLASCEPRVDTDTDTQPRATLSF